MNLQRLDYDEFTFEVYNSGDKYKLVKLNPITGLEEDIELNLPNDNYFEINNNYIVYTGNFTFKINIRLEEDGVYKLIGIINDGRIEIPIINTLSINNYLFNSAKDYICCCPNKPCDDTTFRENDYTFNVVSNMVFSFLGYEFNDLNTSLPSSVSLKDTAEIIYRINEYLLTDDVSCQC